MKKLLPLLPQLATLDLGLRRRSLIAAGVLGLAMPMAAYGQFTANCPSNILQSTSPTTCDAVVTFADPYGTGGVIGDTTFFFTGSEQIFVVPAGVGQVTIETWGAQGQTNALGVTGGLGGYATGVLSVIPGETLYVYVGGGGSSTTAGGFNGGGNGGSTLNCASANAGGGGGASDVRQNGNTVNDRVIVAGGGGGAGGDRLISCGRGSGGGGGGGWYGGGGGSGWPGATGTLPTGGTQSAGGAGGITVSTAGATNGLPGTFGSGGNGGDEVGSNQGGSATALAGGTGGGLTGGTGLYSQNWTGQSGAGGSGYVGTLGTSSMQSGIRAGNGEVKIYAPISSTVVQTAGLPSGSTYPVGVTTNAFTITQASMSDTCMFTVTVQDLVAPQMTCPPDTVELYPGANCEASLPDFTTSVNATDGCDPNPVVTQSVAAGTILSGVGTSQSLTVDANDNANNASQCAFVVTLVDTVTPVIVSCPPVLSYANNVLDCDSMSVNFSLPTFSDNCTFVLQGSHLPGDMFAPGTTVVTYLAVDMAGNNAGCSFVVSVGSPVLDGIVAEQAVCDGQPFTLTAANGYASYTWSTGDTSASITSNSPGWFWVDVSDTSGCVGRDSVFYQYPALPSPVVVPTGAQVCTGTFATYQWYQNSVLIPGATSQCYQPTSDGDFTVAVTDSLGCSGVSSPLTFVGLNDGLPVLRFEVYPNPAQDQVQVRVSQPLTGPAQLRLYDLSGKMVRYQTNALAASNIMFDMSGLPAGTYVLQLSSEGMTGQQRIVKLD